MADMAKLSTVGADDIIRVYRWAITHTPTGEPCAGAPYEQLSIMTHGATNITLDIRKQAVGKDGVPTCVPGLIMLRDELNKIIDEYSSPRACRTCGRRCECGGVP
jgi:hypothetical protein